MAMRPMLTAALGLALLLPAAVNASPTGKRGEPLQPKLVQVVYPVADLVIPVDRGAEKSPATVEGQLMDLIGKTVRPATWLEQGGRGCLQYYPLNMALVVTQTAEVQEEVAHLLAALRRLQDVEISVEMRIVSMPAAATGEVRKLTGLTHNAEPVFLSTKELLRCLEVAQSDSGTNIMQAPKVTMFNGQHSVIDASTTQAFVTEYKVLRNGDDVDVVPHTDWISLGLHCEFQPVVSADRRAVQLALNFRHTSLKGPVPVMPVTIRAARDGGPERMFQCFVQQPAVEKLAFKNSSTIPEGRTLAVSLGQTMVETRTESSVPILSRIPYVSRLVRNVGYGRDVHELFLFVTPRVIVNEEETIPAVSIVPLP